MSDLILEVGKSYLSKSNLLVIITHKRDNQGVPHYTGNNLRLYHENGANFIPQSSSDSSPLDHLITEVEHASNVTEVGQVLLSKMMKAYDQDQLYNKWFHDILVAWINPKTHDITASDALDRANYIAEHASRETKYTFMQNLVMNFDKLMIDVNKSVAKE